MCLCVRACVCVCVWVCIRAMGEAMLLQSDGSGERAGFRGYCACQSPPDLYSIGPMRLSRWSAHLIDRESEGV